MGAESTDVTAGLGGFLAFFLLAVALYFLMRNMNARMRRMAYRQELEGGPAHDGEPGAGSDDAGPDDAGPDDAGTDGPELDGPRSGPGEGPALG